MRRCKKMSVAIPRDWYVRFKPEMEYKQMLHDTDLDKYKIYCEIQKKRLQILVWSRMYYELDESSVDDFKYDKTGFELVAMQNKYPEIADHVPFADAFHGWDASTGFDLPTADIWVVDKVHFLTKEKQKEK